MSLKKQNIKPESDQASPVPTTNFQEIQTTGIIESTLPQDASGEIQSLGKAMRQPLSTNTMQGGNGERKQRQLENPTD